MQPVFIISFNVGALAAALGVGEPDVKALMTDARIATPIIQRRIASDHPGWMLTAGSGGSDELRDPQKQVWRVKSITAQTNFPPSKQIGFDRTIDEKGIIANWAGLKGYILIDIALFPNVKVSMVPIANIIRWYNAGKLGANAKASRGLLVGQLLPDVQFDK